MLLFNLSFGKSLVVTSGVVGRISEMASRPLVLPDTYSGEGNWSQWIYHFESVAEVNEWDDAKKIMWLKVRLTGRAQMAFQHLSDTLLDRYADSKTALKERASQIEWYRAEFESRRKRKAEGWGDYAEDLRTLVEKAYPSLQEEARVQMALSHYLRQIEEPMIAFSVKQKRPKSLDEAVSATLEMESYQTGLKTVLPFEEKPQKELEIAVIRGQSPQDGLIQQLVQRLEKIELELSASRPERGEGSAEKERQVTQGRGRSTTCWYCGRRGHLSRECFKKQREQGNSRPSAH